MKSGKFIAVIIFTLVCASCVSYRGDALRSGSEVINICESALREASGEAVPEEADRAYVDVFRRGYSVAFTRGAVGTFGRRSRDYESLLVCGVSEERVVFLQKTLVDDPLIDEVDRYPYENYDEDVIEILFVRDEAGGFKYCCSQKFDEKNIEKNNPNYPW